MRSLVAFLIITTLTGCGWSESKFVEKYAETDCAYLMECLDPAVLTFLGWDTTQDCVDDRGTEIVTEAQGCEYNRKAARTCVKGIEEMTCPADGEEPDYPPECSEVYFDCDEGDTGDTGDTGT